MRWRSFRQVILLFASSFLFHAGCGHAPSDPPPMRTGQLEISAYVDTTLVDSMEVVLDADSLGLQPNPCLLSGLPIGWHEVRAFKEDPQSPVEFRSPPKLVEIDAGQRSKLLLQLSKFAPDFQVTTTEGRTFLLSDYQSRIVLLVFYTYT